MVACKDGYGTCNQGFDTFDTRDMRFLSSTTPVVVNTRYVIAHASRGEIEWLDTISSSAAALDVVSVFLTCSDWSYQPRFEELVQHSSTFFNSTLAIVAFDNRTYDYFVGRDVDVFLHVGKDIWGRVWDVKFRYVSLLLRKGLTVTFSEMDIYWRNTPHLSKKAQLIVSQHKMAQNAEVNIGFYHVVPTFDTLLMFETLVDWMDVHTPPYSVGNSSDCWAADQKLFDLALRGPDSNTAFVSYKNCRLPKEQINFLTKSNVTWEYLPATVLEHWPIEDPSLATVVGVHIWSLYGNPSEQFKWVSQHFLNYKVPTGEPYEQT